MAQISRLVCPHCGALFNTDQKREHANHVEICHEVLEAIRAASATEAECARDELRRGNLIP